MTSTGSGSWRRWAKRKTVIHRHLNHQGLNLAAVGDVVARGKSEDWEELRLALLASPEFPERVQQVCHARIAAPRAQRFHSWMH
jgi:hypothetical protein